MEATDLPPAQQAFNELLQKRNINPDDLLRLLPDTYRRWLALYSQTHEESFLAQIRNEINRVRRRVQGLPIQREDAPQDH